MPFAKVQDIDEVLANQQIQTRGMLVEQAAEAFEWWRGVRPDSQSMIPALTAPLI